MPLNLLLNENELAEQTLLGGDVTVRDSNQWGES